MTPNSYTADAYGIYFLGRGGLSAPTGLTANPMVGAEFLAINATATMTGGTFTYSFPAARKAFKVMGFRIIAQDNVATTYTVKNGSDTVCAITDGTPTAGVVTEENSISPTYSTIDVNDVLSITIARASTGAVSILVDIVPINNA